MKGFYLFTRFMMADIKGDITQTMNYYGMFGRDGVHITANLHFADKASCDGDCINTFVSSWMDNLPDKRWASWMVSDMKLWWFKL